MHEEEAVRRRDPEPLSVDPSRFHTALCPVGGCPWVLDGCLGNADIPDLVRREGRSVRIRRQELDRSRQVVRNDHVGGCQEAGTSLSPTVQVTGEEGQSYDL